MKKIIIILFLFFIYFTINAYSDESKIYSLKIGYIDLQKALSAHPEMENSMKELQKFQEERQRDIEEKTRGKDLSPEERDKIADLIKRYEREIAEKDNELTSKLITDIGRHMEKVVTRRGISIVFEKSAIFWGGIDITDDVIKEFTAK